MAGRPSIATLAVVAALPLLASVGALAGGDEQPSEFWRDLREGGLRVVDDLKERARPRRDYPPATAQSSYGEATGEDLTPPQGTAERWLPPGVTAPTFSRITIEPRGQTRIAGRGTPGCRVILRSSGQVVGTALVSMSGQWQAVLDRPLEPGVHRIESSVRESGRDQIVVGSDVRIAIPERLPGEVIVAYNGETERRDPVRDRAEALANDASREFTQLMPKKGDEPAPGRPTGPPGVEQPDASNPVVRWLERSAREYQDTVIPELSGSAPEPAGDSLPTGTTPTEDPGLTLAEEAMRLKERAGDWLAKAQRDYQDEVARRLSVPPAGVESPAEASRRESETRSGESGPSEPKAVEPTDAPDQAHDARRERERREQEAEEVRRIAEIRRREEEARRAEEARKEAESRRLAEEAERRLTVERLAEDRRRQEAAERQAAEARRLEEDARKAAEMRRQQEEAARREAEARQRQDDANRSAEDKRKLEEEQRNAEVQRKAEEKRRREEARRKTAEERKAADAAKKEEAKRIAEEAAQKAAERKRLAEEARREAAERRADADRLRREEAVQKREQERAEQEEEAARLAADVERRREEAQEGSDDTVARAETVPPARAKSARRKPRDPRPVEGSAEGDDAGPVRKPKRPRATAVAPKSCAGPRIVHVKGRRMYLVQPEDSLWSLARRFYGSGTRYNTIYKANRGRIRHPDVIRDCQRLYIPGRQRRSEAGSDGVIDPEPLLPPGDVSEPASPL